MIRSSAYSLSVAVILTAGCIFAQTNAPVEAVVAEAELRQEDKSCPVSLDIQLDFFSQYIWRGMVYSLEPAFQPAFILNYDAGDLGTFYVGTWVNVAIGDNRPSHAAGITEFDYLAGWSRDFGDFTLDLGYIYYQLLGMDPPNAYNTHEANIGLTYNTPIVNPYVKLYYDFNESNSSYLQAGLNRCFALTDDERLTLKADAYLSWGSSQYNAYYFDDDQGNLTDYNLLLKLTYAITEQISVSGIVALSGFIDGTIRDSAKEIQDYSDIFWGGFSIGVTL